MSTEENKAAERRFHEEVWHKRNLAAIDELVAPDVIEHNPNVPGQGPGREGFRQSIETILAVSPDIQITMEDSIAEGDKVVVRWLARGTYQGEFMGTPPTNKPVTVMGIDIMRYRGGQRVETWRQWDALGFMQQAGVVPSPGPSGQSPAPSGCTGRTRRGMRPIRRCCHLPGREQGDRAALR